MTKPTTTLVTGTASRLYNKINNVKLSKYVLNNLKNIYVYPPIYITGSYEKALNDGLFLQKDYNKNNLNEKLFYI